MTSSVVDFALVPAASGGRYAERMRRLGVSAAALVGALLLAGCSSSSADAEDVAAADCEQFYLQMDEMAGHVDDAGAVRNSDRPRNQALYKAIETAESIGTISSHPELQPLLEDVSSSAADWLEYSRAALQKGDTEKPDDSRFVTDVAAVDDFCADYN